MQLSECFTQLFLQVFVFAILLDFVLHLSIAAKPTIHRAESEVNASGLFSPSRRCASRRSVST